MMGLLCVLDIVPCPGRTFSLMGKANSNNQVKKYTSTNCNTYSGEMNLVQ